MDTRVTVMAVQDAVPLSRFFRIAVVAGVESAVQIHIDRGDDLNARDHQGQTPLMISAARNKAGICELLLAAGADASLLDPSGRDAFGIAQAAGALEAAAAIHRFHIQPAMTSSAAQTVEPTQAVDYSSVAGVPEAAPDMTPLSATADAIDQISAFDLGAWEAEEDHPPPAADPTLAFAASTVHAVITEHHPIDTSADWDDFEAFLPDRAASLPDAEDAEARESLRLVLLRAIREGSVPHSCIEDLARGDDGEPDAEAAALLGMVINDLGAETDERFEYSASHETFEVFVAPDEEAGEEEVIAEAMKFVDELAARRNEPLRLYQREFQRQALLTADAEVALGQAMERGVEKALDALAAWPGGIAATLNAACEVARGVKPLRWMCCDSQAYLQGAETPLRDESVEVADVDASLELAATVDGSSDVDNGHDSPLVDRADTPADELAEFRASIKILTDLSVGTSQGAPPWEACREALASLRLTRNFLMELENSALSGEGGAAVHFAKAMTAYRHARDQMAVANLKLVHSIARKYLFSGQPLDDLLQEGNIGLIKAVDRYDWRRGFKFSTYATWWIRQQVGRYVADNGKTIRLPVHVYEKTQRIAHATHTFEVRFGHAPTLNEVAALVELPLEKVEALSLIGFDPLPLHELSDIDDLIAAHAKDHLTARDPAELVDEIQLRESVDRFLATLKLKERNIVRMRFGIGVQDSMTLEEIGTLLDVTRERIRQIEVKAFRRLRHPARLDRLMLELGMAPDSMPEESSDLPGDSDTEADGETPAASSPNLKEATPGIPLHDLPHTSKRTSLDKLLDQVREAGIVVEDYLEGDSRRLWVHITEASDIPSRRLVRKLISLGFVFWPGKGYWR